LAAIAAFTLAVIAMFMGEQLAATVLFLIATTGFLATLVLQRKR
jgi:hypothetical protein